MENLNEIENKILDFSDGIEKILENLSNCYEEENEDRKYDSEIFESEYKMEKLVEDLKVIKDKLHKSIDETFKDVNTEFTTNYKNEGEDLKLILDKKKEFLSIK